MAQAKPCPRCGQPHFNFQKCQVRENQKDNISLWKTRPNLPAGYRLWNQDHLETYERQGNLIIQRSGLKLKPHGGTVTEPKEEG